VGDQLTPVSAQFDPQENVTDKLQVASPRWQAMVARQTSFNSQPHALDSLRFPSKRWLRWYGIKPTLSLLSAIQCRRIWLRRFYDEWPPDPPTVESLFWSTNCSYLRHHECYVPSRQIHWGFHLRFHLGSIWSKDPNVSRPNSPNTRCWSPGRVKKYPNVRHRTSHSRICMFVCFSGCPYLDYRTRVPNTSSSSNFHVL